VSVLSSCYQYNVLKAYSLQLFFYPREQTVSEGSLYLMRSCLSPSLHSALSVSGSAPASNSNSLHERGFKTNNSKSSLTPVPFLLSTTVSLDSLRDVSTALCYWTGRTSSLHSPNLPQFLSQSHPTVGLASHCRIRNHSSSAQPSRPLRWRVRR
jgi:hypothetical protein